MRALLKPALLALVVLPVACVESDPPEVGWIRDNAVKLQTVEAGHGLDDMQPLKWRSLDLRLTRALFRQSNKGKHCATSPFPVARWRLRRNVCCRPNPDFCAGLKSHANNRSGCGMVQQTAPGAKHRCAVLRFLSGTIPEEPECDSKL